MVTALAVAPLVSLTLAAGGAGAAVVLTFFKPFESFIVPDSFYSRCSFSNNQMPDFGCIPTVRPKSKTHSRKIFCFDPSHGLTAPKELRSSEFEVPVVRCVFVSRE